MRHIALLDQLDSSWRDMLAAGDMFAIRCRILKAATFAACTAHTTVERAEYEYVTWAEAGEFPSDGTNLSEQKASAAMTAEAWTETLDIETVRGWRDGWALAAELAAHVYGLGTAKAAFAAALVGYPEPYCLDTHCLQLVAERLTCLGTPSSAEQLRRVTRMRYDSPTSATRSWQRYREVGDTTFGSRAHQWEFFAMKVEAFRDGAHEAYFRTVLP